MSDIKIERTGVRLSLSVVSAIIGALLGVITAIFTAGIYYQKLNDQLSDYAKRIDKNEIDIARLSSELTLAKASLGSLTTSLVKGLGKASENDQSQCPPGTYVTGLRLFSEDGLAHGALYALHTYCREFNSP
jgi:hypothetical protein